MSRLGGGWLRRHTMESIHHLAMVATAGGSQSGPVATAATRWSTTQCVQPANPPSGDGGYRKRLVKTVL
jgi:hypothetical protein